MDFQAPGGRGCFNCESFTRPAIALRAIPPYSNAPTNLLPLVQHALHFSTYRWSFESDSSRAHIPRPAHLTNRIVDA